MSDSRLKELVIPVRIYDSNTEKYSVHLFSLYDCLDIPAHKNVFNVSWAVLNYVRGKNGFDEPLKREALNSWLCEAETPDHVNRVFDSFCEKLDPIFLKECYGNYQKEEVDGQEEESK